MNFKSWITIIIFIFGTIVVDLSIVSVAKGESLAGTVVEKAKNPSDWLSRTTLKYGFVLTMCATNVLRMANEADEFDSRNILGTNTNHVVDLGIIIGYILIGYELYAISDRDTWSWKEKAALVGSGLLLSREAGEFTYQGLRHNDPFNNNPDWHKCEFVYPKWSNGKLTDGYISTGKFSTPASHIGFTSVGLGLLYSVH